MDSHTHPNKPIFPEGQELYDLIMGQIEPELLSDELPQLAESHAGDSAEQKDQCLAKWTRAFSEYDFAYRSFIADADHKVAQYRSMALKSFEADDRRSDEERMKAIDQAWM